jgi:hypothetical protein
MTDLSPAAQAVFCPVCQQHAIPKPYGPFFTPDPVYRMAMACPSDHWRGRMCETIADAIAAELEKANAVG